MRPMIPISIDQSMVNENKRGIDIAVAISGTTMCVCCVFDDGHMRMDQFEFFNALLSIMLIF